MIIQWMQIIIFFTIQHWKLLVNCWRGIPEMFRTNFALVKVVLCRESNFFPHFYSDKRLFSKKELVDWMCRLSVLELIIETIFSTRKKWRFFLVFNFIFVLERPEKQSHYISKYKKLCERVCILINNWCNQKTKLNRQKFLNP